MIESAFISRPWMLRRCCCSSQKSLHLGKQHIPAAPLLRLQWTPVQLRRGHCVASRLVQRTQCSTLDTASAADARYPDDLFNLERRRITSLDSRLWHRPGSSLWVSGVRRSHGLGRIARQAATTVPRAVSGSGAFAAEDAEFDGDPNFEDDDDYFVQSSADGKQEAYWSDSDEEGASESRGHALGSMLARVPERTMGAVAATARATGNMLREVRHRAGSSAKRTPVGRAVGRARTDWDDTASELPKDLWGRVVWFWDRPAFQRLRFTISMANLSVRLPAIIALVGTQIGLLATQVSLPMLAPLLLGTGMMFRSIKANASIIFPRLGLLVVLLWVLWFANSVVQNTVALLRRQGAIDHRVSGAIINASEVAVLVAAVVIILSMLGINLSGLLIPAGVAVALAAKDLSHNFLAGFFLFAVQPFKLGDRVGINADHGVANGTGGPQGAWFEGICEKVDLRYTTIKSGRRRLLVPNSAFITRAFMVMDDVAPEGGAPPPWQGNTAPPQQQRGEDPHQWVRQMVHEERPYHAAPVSSRNRPVEANGAGDRPWSKGKQQPGRRPSGPNTQESRFYSDDTPNWDRPQQRSDADPYGGGQTYEGTL